MRVVTLTEDQFQFVLSVVGDTVDHTPADELDQAAEGALDALNVAEVA